MDKELKAKWVAALRSGEYKQGQGDYYDSAMNAHCCLNVLALVANNGVLPARRISIEKKAGDDGVLSTLTNMNDSGKSFAEIADYIEANL